MVKREQKSALAPCGCFASKVAISLTLMESQVNKLRI
jgi:hypothetical protein